jgi:hypothetical protein
MIEAGIVGCSHENVDMKETLSGELFAVCEECEEVIGSEEDFDDRRSQSYE